MERTVIQLNSELRDALATIMVLPKGLIALDLRMRVGEAPQLTCTTFVYDAEGRNVDDGGKALTVTKTYHLVENSDG
jgi:hypothetical protein